MFEDENKEPDKNVKRLIYIKTRPNKVFIPMLLLKAEFIAMIRVLYNVGNAEQ